ncbi:MAG: hypothetical protein RJA20_955 [Bacteroidota bacterium]|jgi:hypothetical protein
MLFEMSVFQCTKYGYYYKIKINFCVRVVKSGTLKKYLI